MRRPRKRRRADGPTAKPDPQPATQRGRQPRRVGSVMAAVAVLAACTNGGHTTHPRPTAPPTTISVLPSADRIRLGQARLGGPASCIDDAYCAAGISRVYGLSLGPRIVSLATPDATLAALEAGSVDIGVLPTASTQLSDPHLTTLVDDRGLLPATNLVPIVSADLVRTAGSSLAATVDEVSAELTPGGLATIEQARGNGQSPDAAARSWLQNHVAAAVPGPAAAGAPPIVIGTRADDQSAAIASVYAGALARYGWRTSTVPVGGDRPEELDALASGRVGLVIDEASPLLEQLTGFSGESTPDADQTVSLLRRQLADLNLVAFAPSPARPGVAFAVSRAVAAALGVNTLSDLARASGAHIPPAPTTTTTTTLSGTPPHSGGTAPARDAEGPPISPVATLGIGDTGQAVVALQNRLNVLGYDRSSPSGLFDETTRRAVVSFQIDSNLIDTGELDAATGRALASAHPAAHPAAVPAPGDPASLRPPPTGGTGATSSPAGTVYLAFASGPSPVTAQILELLRAHHATATFFTDALALARDPDPVRLEAAAGNGVGVSELPHDGSSPIAGDVMFRTADRTQEALAPLLSRTPTCLLAPYGATDAASRQRAQQLGLRVVLSDVDPQDWRKPGADAIAADVASSARAGAVVLLHDGGGDRAQTVVAVAKVLDTLTARGFGFAAIPDC